MLLGRVHVELSEAKINDIDVVFGRLSAPDHEVVGLNVTVNDAVLVTFLDSVNLQIFEL